MEWPKTINQINILQYNMLIVVVHPVRHTIIVVQDVISFFTQFFYQSFDGSFTKIYVRGKFGWRTCKSSQNKIKDAIFNKCFLRFGHNTL